MKILHLYADLMNMYGEYGNVVVLQKHLQDQGFKVEIVNKSIGSRFDFMDYDFIYCGSGLESNEKVALEDLMKRKKNFLEAVKNNKMILFTGNAMELLGKKIDDKQALGLFDYETVCTDSRHSGDVIVQNDIFGQVVGFVNKCSIVTYKEKAYFSYFFKDDGLSDDGDSEGARMNNCIATHLIGPLLVKNPKLIQSVVNIIAKQNKKAFKYKNIEYPYEDESYRVTLNALTQRKTK